MEERTTRRGGNTHYLYLGHEDVTATERKVSRSRPRQGHQLRPPGRGSLSETPSIDHVTR